MNLEYCKIWQGEKALESTMVQQEPGIMYTIVALVKSEHVVGQFRLDEGEGKDVEYFLNPTKKPLHEPLTKGQIGMMRINQAQWEARHLVRAEDHENYGK